MRTQWVFPEISDAELLEVERTITRYTFFITNSFTGEIY
jgi:hypothetical protein